jgi:ubiquinone/menaquinone biosynthesis C-methylase UbiE
MTAEYRANQKPLGTREWYDIIGELSDILPGLHLGGPEATDKLLELCQLDSSSHVLDVGCGSGHTACLIAERYGGRVQGIDLSDVMIRKAQERARSRGVTDQVEFRVADATQMPFEKDSFDVVFFESVLTPLPGDKKQALSEMVKVVRPGGRVAANESTVDPSAPDELLALLREHPAIYGHFTSQTLRDLFQESGLHVVQLIENQASESPSAFRLLGFRGLLSFMIRVYPRILLRLLRDARFRQASRVDDAITKRWKAYMGYTLIVGQKAG